MRKKGASVTKSATVRSSAPSRRATTTTSASKRKDTIRRRKSESKELQLDHRTEKLLNEAPTLAQSVRKDEAAAARIDAKTAELERVYGLEREIDRAIAARHLTRSQLADRLGVDRSSISRDLNRGLGHATIARITQVVDALDFEFLPVVLPKHGKRERAEHIARVLITVGISLADIQSAQTARHPRRKKAVA